MFSSDLSMQGWTKTRKSGSKQTILGRFWAFFEVYLRTQKLQDCVQGLK